MLFPALRNGGMEHLEFGATFIPTCTSLLNTVLGNCTKAKDAPSQFPTLLGHGVKGATPSYRNPYCLSVMKFKVKNIRNLFHKKVQNCGYSIYGAVNYYIFRCTGGGSTSET